MLIEAWDWLKRRHVSQHGETWDQWRREPELEASGQ
jgi:hypothetical protein